MLLRFDSVCLWLDVQPRRVVPYRARVSSGGERRSWPGDVGSGAECAFGSGPLWVWGWSGPRADPMHC